MTGFHLPIRMLSADSNLQYCFISSHPPSSHSLTKVTFYLPGLDKVPTSVMCVPQSIIPVEVIEKVVRRVAAHMNIALWIIQGLAALAFAYGGWLKAVQYEKARAEWGWVKSVPKAFVVFIGF